MKSCFFSLVVLTLIAARPALAQNPPLRTDLYPLEVGYRWDYRAIDLNDKNRRASKLRIEVDRTEPFERKELDKDKKPIVAKYTGFMLKSTSEGKITFDHVVVMTDGLSRVAVAGTPLTPPTPIRPALLFFKMPLGKDTVTGKDITTWEVDSISGTTSIKGTFKFGREFVRVPAGRAPDGGFDAFVISYRDGPANNPRLEIDTWYTEDVGMVKQRIKGRGINMEHQLEDYNFKKR